MVTNTEKYNGKVHNQTYEQNAPNQCETAKEIEDNIPIVIVWQQAAGHICGKHTACLMKWKIDVIRYSEDSSVHQRRIDNTDEPV